MPDGNDVVTGLRDSRRIAGMPSVDGRARPASRLLTRFATELATDSATRPRNAARRFLVAARSPAMASHSRP